jgi:hypothetical protein
VQVVPAGHPVETPGVGQQLPAKQQIPELQYPVAQSVDAAQTCPVG